MTSILVATTGGHLAQLHHLAPRLDVVEQQQLWVTHETPQSVSLLADHEVAFVPYVSERDVPGVARCARHAWSLFRRRRPSSVVSTGSAIALGYLGVATALGIPAYYIESAARSTGPSTTGRVLARWPRVKLFTQFPQRAEPPWDYVGSVFDGFEPVDRLTEPGRALRLVVTVGSTDWQFDRLLRRVAALAPAGVEIVWQAGASDIAGLPGDVRRFVPAAELAAELEAADVVIAHAGCGSALAALEAGKAPILVPRKAAHGEIGVDHQEQLADMLEARGLARHRDVDDLSWRDVEAAAGLGVRLAATPAVLSVGRR